jgi:hypothetical protein
LAVIATPSFYSRNDGFSEATSVLSDLGDLKQPCRHIGGRCFDKGYVDVAGLQDVLGKDKQPIARNIA